MIGSGPAGLTAAYDLRLSGYPVTVFEAESEPGGMLRHGIAEYRLPRQVIDEEIDVIARTGVEIKTGMRVGVEIELQQIADQYSATLLAVGAQRGKSLGIDGEYAFPEIEDALGFLLLSPTFPRSVFSCVTEAEQLLADLEGGGDASSPRRRLGRLRADLEFQDVAELMTTTLPAYLEALQQRTLAIAADVADRFFSGDERELQLQEWRGGPNTGLEPEEVA